MRFFSLHYLLPFVIAAVVILHIWALHIPGSSNPTGVDVKEERDTLPFHPFYTAKDGFGAGVFLILFALTTYFAPNYLGHPDNYIPANPLATPAHIVPEWYFWPFYAILRAFTVDFILPAKLWGVLAMFSSILLLFFLPWLDRSPVRSGTYRPLFKRFFWILIADLLLLGWAGGSPATPAVVAVSQIAAAYYFAHFLIILPLISKFERTLPLPNSISESVLHGEKQEAAPVGVKPRASAAAE
jgi:ubiquinol-cytochrome c reductase cytochrome b subunit